MSVGDKINFKVAFILNYAAHYRLPLYKKYNESFGADFYFGSRVKQKIKKVDYSEVEGFECECKTVFFGRFIWLAGSLSVLRKNYSHVVLTGDPNILSNWVFLLLSKFFNVHVLLHTHGWYGNETKIKSIIKKLYFNLSDGLLLYGGRAKRLMINEGFEPSFLNVVYNSLDYDKQLEIRNEVVSSTLYNEVYNNTNPVVVFIGRLTFKKDLELLIDAQNILESKGFPINVLFVGDGEARKHLEIRAGRGLGEKVCFLGAVYNEELIAPYLYNADLCVSPGFVGLTAMHSLVYGTPVVTHNNFMRQAPECEAIIEGITGGFFEEGSADSLAEKIRECLSWNESREIIRKRCMDEIDSKWNVNYQVSVLRKAFGFVGD